MIKEVPADIMKSVALHPEGVDRNALRALRTCRTDVALHPEGVDRNTPLEIVNECRDASPSTRRAWIEIAIVSGIWNGIQCRPPPGGRG